MSPRRRTAALAALVLLLPLVLLWPLPLVLGDAVLAAPGFEAASHIWGLWAAQELAQPLVIETDLLAWPDGVRLVLVDPINLPAFALGHRLGGPALGFNLVAWTGLSVAGAAGALLAREVDASPLVGAAVAMATPPLVCAPGDGMTEDLALAWVGLQLALLLRYRRTGEPSHGVAATLALGACAWAGPYAAMLAVAVDLPIALASVSDRRRLARTVVVGLGGLVLAAPVVVALAGRDLDQPGSSARAGMPLLDEGPERFRGGLMSGADLLDAWLPAPLTGGVPDISHTAYLGIFALVAAVVAVAREPRRWPWLAGAVALSVVALGPHLTVAGQALRTGERPLLGPVGLLILAAPAAGRVTRWYRAATIAGLLLAPLAARSVVGRPRRAMVLVGAVLLDTLLLAPLPWPHPASPLPDGDAWDSAAWDSTTAVESGAVLELPLTTSGTPPPGHWRDAAPLAQASHGRPTAASMMGLPPSPVARRGQQSLQRLLRSGQLPADERSALRAAGFRLIALRTTYLPVTSEAERALDACLGPPLHRSAGIRIHALAAASSDCQVREP